MVVFWTVWTAAVILFLIFGAVILVGAPYMPTLAKDRQTALDLLNLKPGQTMYELGSGDGSVLKDAADRGLRVVGYELNPILVVVSRFRTLKYGRRVKIKWGNYWKANLSKADGIFVFLLDRYMEKLDKKIETECKNGTRLVSHAFTIPNKKPSAKKAAMMLYVYKGS